MDEPLDELYIQWLYRQVASPRFRIPTRTYWSLIRLLFKKEFVWIVPNDDNRVEDGRDLRYEFLDELQVERDVEWIGIGCSMLEMLIALSRRLSFETEGEPRGWFWELLDNVGLSLYNDANYKKSDDRKINRTLDKIIWREYRPDGQGGLFPLEHADQDQRDVELWYQQSYYLLEQD